MPASRYVAVPEICLPAGIDVILKLSSPVQGICSGRYIDSTKLIYDAFTRWNQFIKFKRMVSL